MSWVRTVTWLSCVNGMAGSPVPILAQARARRQKAEQPLRRAGGGFTPGQQAARGRARVEGDEAPALAPLRQPELFIRIVAAAEIDLARPVVFQHALHHAHAENGADREIVEAAIMRQLVDGGAAVPQDPALRRRRFAVEFENAGAEERGFQRGEARIGRIEPGETNRLDAVGGYFARDLVKRLR